MKMAEETGGWLTFSKVREKSSEFNSRDRFKIAIE